MNWLKNLKGKIKFNEPLAKYTSFKIGGRAEIFVEPKGVKELRALVLGFKKNKMPFFVLGQGTNLLVSKDILKAAVIRLSSPDFRKVSLRANVLSIGPGVRIAEMISFAKKSGLGGIEFLWGIPGSIGGALVMNAGIKARSIGDLVKCVTAMDYNGKIKVLNRKQLRFGYRKSNLSKFIVLSAELNLVKSTKSQVDAAIADCLAYRRKTQLIPYPNAGCIFKNPGGDSAGRLIDLCGLKGERRGGAAVSSQHANFIVNHSNARAEDVLALMELIQKKVREKFSIDLKPEIKIW